MELTKAIIESDSVFSLEQLNGTTSDVMPFVAFLAKATKDNVRLKIACSESGQPVSQFAASSKALAAINGGFHVLNSVIPLDWLVVGWKTVQKLENMNRPCISLDGSRVSIVQPSELAKPADVLQSGPLLLMGGKTNADFSDYRKNAAQFDRDLIGQRSPRTAFGMNDTHFFFLVVDGGSKESAGLYLRELAQLTSELGMRDAINLGGSGLSTMVVNGKLVNKPRSAAHQAEPAEKAVSASLLLLRKIEPTIQPRQQRPGASKPLYRTRRDF